MPNAEALPVPIDLRGLLISEALPSDRHPAAVYLASLGTRSRPVMRQSLQLIAALVSGGKADIRTLAWHRLRYPHTAAVRSRLAEVYAPATVNRLLAALKGTLREAWRLKLMKADDYQRAIDLRGIRSHTLPRGRALSGGELKALFAACADGTKAGVRDAALFAVLYAGGLRRSEAVGLDLANYNLEDGTLTVLAGKGHKDRIQPLCSSSNDALKDWISLRGGEDGALFIPINKGDRIAHRRLISQAVLGICKRRGAEAELAPFSPHCLRYGFVSDLLQAGVDLSTVKRLAGHSSEVTTGRYDRRGESAKADAAKLLFVPYLRQPHAALDSASGGRDA